MSDPRSCYRGRGPRVPRRLPQTTGNADYQAEHSGMMAWPLTPSLDGCIQRCAQRPCFRRRAHRHREDLLGWASRTSPIRARSDLRLFMAVGLRLFQVASLTLILRIDLLAGAGEDREDFAKF